jgi:hypothetical protein
VPLRSHASSQRWFCSLHADISETDIAEATYDERIQVVRYAALVLILGTIVTSYAQRDQQDEKQNEPEKQAVKQPKQGTYAPP